MTRTIAGVSGREMADSIFRGCENRTAVAAFLVAQHAEARITGAVIGFAAGALVTFGALAYLRAKGSL
jgi:hypothetical protein